MQFLWRFVVPLMTLFPAVWSLPWTIQRARGGPRGPWGRQAARLGTEHRTNVPWTGRCPSHVLREAGRWTIRINRTVARPESSGRNAAALQPRDVFESRDFETPRHTPHRPDARCRPRSAAAGKGPRFTKFPSKNQEPGEVPRLRGDEVSTPSPAALRRVVRPTRRVAVRTAPR